MQPAKASHQSDFRLIVLLTVALLICLQHLPSKNDVQSSQAVWPIVWRDGDGIKDQGLYFDKLAPESLTGSTLKLPPHIAPIFFKPIPINKASVETLTIIPGIGNSIAQKIVDYRLKSGEIDNVNDLKDIDGIGQKKAATIMQYVKF